MTDWPGFRFVGKVPPESAKPVPAMAAELTVTGSVPEDVSVTVCVAVVFKVTLPNAMLEELTLSIAEPAFICNPKVFDTLPALAVSVAV